MGFCFGGPYAIIGPKRLGYDAGISCHGTRMMDFIHELDGVTKPVCIIWGDQDHAAPAEVLAAYRAVPARMPNVEVHMFPGVLHGYMMRLNTKAFHAETRAFSMAAHSGSSMGCAAKATAGAAPSFLTAQDDQPRRRGQAPRLLTSDAAFKEPMSKTMKPFVWVPSATSAPSPGRWGSASRLIVGDAGGQHLVDCLTGATHGPGYSRCSVTLPM